MICKGLVGNWSEPVKVFLYRYRFCIIIPVVLGVITLLAWLYYPRMGVVSAWACTESKCDQKVLLLHGEVDGLSLDWVRYRIRQELKKTLMSKQFVLPRQEGPALKLWKLLTLSTSMPLIPAWHLSISRISRGPRIFVGCASRRAFG